MPGSVLTLEFKNLENVWNGRRASVANELKAAVISTDGKNWGEPRMTHTASFDAQARIGLFTCSGNTFAATSATFDGVALGK